MGKLKHSSSLKSKHRLLFSKRYYGYSRCMLKINDDKQQNRNLAARLKEAIATLARGGKVRISEKCGVSPTAITGWLKTGRIDKVNIEIGANITGYSLHWLITGKGDKQASPTNLPEATPTAQPPGDDFVAIHFGSFKLEAGISGFSVDYQDESMKPIFFRDDWLRINNFNAAKLIACHINGDSMEPRLYSGDSVVINTEKNTPIDGKVFAVNYEGEMVIKRLYRDGGNWYLRSDNPDKTRYPDKLCSGDICIMIGLVVHRQSTEI